MPHTRLPLLLLLLAWLLHGCSDPPFHEAEYYVFGTLVEVSLSDVDDALASQAFAQLQERFQAMHRDWHAWEPGKLMTINRQFARGLSAPADAELVRLVQYSRQAEVLSGGRFNATIGNLIELWGFHTSDYPITGPIPSAREVLERVAQHPSALDIEVRSGQLFSRNPAVRLDFGGIAKGYAVDLACAELMALGVRNAIVNAGGDLRAFGQHGARPWRVAIRDPLGGTLVGIEILHDEAVFTSGNYERFHESPTRERYAHILDPRTGWPARQVVSATVVAREGWLADAAATALIVAGLDEWDEVASAMQLELVLLVDQAGRIHATSAMQQRLIGLDGHTPVMTLRRN